MRENERRRRQNEVRKKRMILMVAGIIVICLILACISLLKEKKHKVDIRQGVQKLKELEKLDTAKVEAEIAAVEKKHAQEQEDWKNRPLSEKFSKAVILGDSITSGFIGYEILDSSKVVAQKGVHLKELDPLIETTANLKPQVLFLALGLNDVSMTGGDSEKFIVAYKKVLASLQEKLPNTRIYINGILPVTPKGIKKYPDYVHIPEFNAALQALCEEEDLIYIDNAPLVKDEYYEPDGEHMKIKFYPIWAEHMAEVAGL